MTTSAAPPNTGIIEQRAELRSPSTVVLLPTKGMNLRSMHRIPLKRKVEASMITIIRPDRMLIAGITFFIIIQCVVVFLLSASVLGCMWNPDKVQNQYLKVVMVMYLFDYENCGYKLQKTQGIRNIELHKDEKGLNLKPLQWTALVKSSSVRLTTALEGHVNVSIGFHCVWMIVATVALIFCHIRALNFKVLKIVISIFMYSCIFMVIYDVSMAILYLAHIQQSLTLSMVLRYAGWAVELKVSDPEEFAGWIPIMASVGWLRGIVILVINIIFIKHIWNIRKKIKKKEVIRKHTGRKNAPIPDSAFGRMNDNSHEKCLVMHA